MASANWHSENKFWYFAATLVGGGFLNGTAESVASNGLIWTQAPFGICLGLIIGKLGRPFMCDWALVSTIPKTVWSKDCYFTIMMADATN